MAQIDVMGPKVAQSARDTADDQGYVYKQYKKYPKATKADARKKEMYDIMESDPSTPERKRLMRRDEYYIKSLADGKRKKVSGSAKGKTAAKGSKSKRATRKRVAGK